MTPFKVHMIHVGPMDNRGTQALFLSDVALIKDIAKGNAEFSVSTTDVDGVRKLNLTLDAVLPQMVDIPYQKADSLAKSFGFDRYSLRYKILAMGALMFMFAETVFSMVSVLLTKCKLRAFYRAHTIETMKECDLVVSYSDENFKEGASLLPLNLFWLLAWWSMLVSRTWEIMVARAFKKPVVMFPNSMGPFRTSVGRFLSKLSLNSCEFVLIRDPVSYGIVSSLGIRSRRILTADTALLFKSNEQPLLDCFSDPRVGVSPGVYGHSLSRDEVRRYVSAHAQALDAVIEKHGFRVFLLPHFVTGFSNDDLNTCRLILAEMKNKDRVEIVYKGAVQEFKAFLDRMDMVVSSKMHPTILAASGYVPVVCVAYDHKQTGFLALLDMSECAIDIREVTYDALLRKMDYVWDNRVRMRDLLREKVPVLQENIRIAAREALAPYIKQANT